MMLFSTRKKVHGPIKKLNERNKGGVCVGEVRVSVVVGFYSGAIWFRHFTTSVGVLSFSVQAIGGHKFPWLWLM
jgi:hypothetical protein